MLIRHTAAYLLGQGVSAVLGFTSVIVYTRLLSPGEYGIYVVGMSIAAILAALFFAWVKFSVFRYESEGDHVDVRLAALTAYGVSAAALPLAFPVLLLVLEFPRSTVLAAGLFALALCFFELSQEILRARLMATHVMMSMVVRSVLAFAIGLAVVLAGGGGLGLLLAVGTAYLLTSAAFARAVWRAPRARVEHGIFKKLLSYGAPTAASSLVFALSATADRLIIAYLLGESASGEYGAAADLVRQVIVFPALSVAGAATPLALRLLATTGPEATRRHLEVSAELLVVIIGPAAVGLAIVSSHVAAVIMGPEFRDSAAALMPILAFAALLSALSQIYVHVSFHLAKKPWLIMAHGTALLVVTLALMFPMVRSFGLIGAAVAILIAEGCGVLIGLLLTRRSFPLPLVPGRLLRVLTAISAMAAATAFIKAHLGRPDLLSLVATIAAGVLVYIPVALLLDLAQSRTLLAQTIEARLRRRSLKPAE